MVISTYYLRDLEIWIYIPESPKLKMWLNAPEFEKPLHQRANVSWFCTLCSLGESSQWLHWVSWVSETPWETNTGLGSFKVSHYVFIPKIFLFLKRTWQRRALWSAASFPLALAPKHPLPHHFDSCSVTTKTSMMDLLLEHNAVCLEKHPL